MKDWLNKNWQWLAAAVLLVAIVVFVVLLRRRNKYSTLTDDQEAMLATLHPKEADVFREFVDTVQRKTGWTVEIVSAYRSFAKQTQLYANQGGLSIGGAAKPGRSFHQYGLAIDIKAKKDGKELRMKSSRSEWEASGIPKIAKELNMRWGGTFANNWDPVHFDVSTRYKIDDLISKAKSQFGSLENTIGNRLKL